MEHLASGEVQLRSCSILRGRTQIYYIFPLPPDWEKWFSIIKYWLNESLMGTKKFVNPQTWAVGVGVGQNNQLGLVANKDLNIRAYTTRVEDLTVCLCLWNIRTSYLLGLLKKQLPWHHQEEHKRKREEARCQGWACQAVPPFHSGWLTGLPGLHHSLLESIGSHTVTRGVSWKADNRPREERFESYKMLCKYY